MMRINLLLLMSMSIMLLASPGDRAATVQASTEHWWTDRVFYEIFVRSFYDSDGDGIGDLQGVISKLDYLNDGDPDTDTDLGITGIWLMPVAESPSYHGYDVMDYYEIEQDYGSNEDFQQLIEEAHERGIAVIVDLVMNHTSSEHPWFIDSQTPGSAHNSWYIWRDERSTYLGPWSQVVWHPQGRRHYYGIFWSGMPDLNYRNPAVTESMYEIARFWLEEMGVDGFRLDAIRYLIEDGAEQQDTDATLTWLQRFHSEVHTVNSDALLVGEAWASSFVVDQYIGDEVDIAFEFDLATAMLESARGGQSSTVASAQERAVDLYPPGQYARFLTNHDQDRVMSVLRGDVNEAKLAAAALLTGPGTPFIYYGEEIGMMGQKPDERIRAPMQWDATPDNAGFTTGRPWESLGTGFEQFNVAAETDDFASLLSTYRTLIRLRQSHPALYEGDYVFVESKSRGVYSFLRHSPEEILLVFINLNDEAETDYGLSLESGPLTEMAQGELVYGEGEPTSPQVNAQGGFEGYLPFPGLPPQSTTIIQFSS